MQSQIDKLDWPANVNILGVNEAGHESGNAINCDGRVIPWLQDRPDEDAWRKWNITFRDVVILDPDNAPVAVYNLSTYNLSVTANYDSLLSLLRQIAEGSAP
jgi:hypothetical protein